MQHVLDSLIIDFWLLTVNRVTLQRFARTTSITSICVLTAVMLSFVTKI